MAYFQYRAVTAEGKVVEGTLQAVDQRAVVAQLEEQGQLPITVTSDQEGGLFGREVSLPWRRKRVPQQDLLAFTQELSTLLSAGLPLDRSLGILTELTENEYFSEIIKDLLREIKGGKSLSEALGMYPRVFPKIYSNMVKAGEMGGVLNQILEHLVEYLESAEELRSYFKSSLIYPAAVALVAGGAIIIMLTVVIPKFAEIFENAGAPVPLPMKIMLTASGTLTSYWWLILLAVAGAWALFHRHINTHEGRLSWDRRLLTMPVLGSVFQKLEVSRFSRTLGTLLNSAVPLIQSISIVKEIVGNQAIASTMEKIKAGVKKGEGLVAPIRESGIFPLFALHLLQVGEETGQLDTMLLRVADTYDRELRVALKRFIALFEPAMIVIMGVLIGVIVVSLMYSIFSIHDVAI